MTSTSNMVKLILVACVALVAICTGDEQLEKRPDQTHHDDHNDDGGDQELQFLPPFISHKQMDDKRQADGIGGASAPVADGDDDRTERLLIAKRFNSNNKGANSDILGPILSPRSYFNYWRPRQRRRRYQRWSAPGDQSQQSPPQQASQPPPAAQWLATIQSQHNQKIFTNTNNNDNINTNNNNIHNNNNHNSNNDLNNVNNDNIVNYNLNNNHKDYITSKSDDNLHSLLPARHIRRPKQSSNSGTKSSKSSQTGPEMAPQSDPAMATVSRGTRGARQYDIPQIECPAAEDGMERFSCPSPDRMGRYRCIDDHVLCDGFVDCPNGEDEDRMSCMFYKTTKAHLDVLADALLRWARGRY